MWKQAIIADIIRLKISFRKERRLESGQGAPLRPLQNKMGTKV
jgi:hypothetical protein